MGMFDSYDNLNPDYVPDNRHSDDEHTMETVEITTPEKIYNAKGNFVGIRWSRGEVVELEFPLQKAVYVAENALIYTEAESMPDQFTVGSTGQKAYNLADRMSWTCVGISDDHYIWVCDEELLVPSNGTKEVYFDREWEGKTASFTLYNFRWEEIHRTTTEAATHVSFSIDKELSESLSEGIYYCTVKLLEDEAVTVTSKTMLIVM